MKFLFRHTYILVFIKDVVVMAGVVAMADAAVFLVALAGAPASCACNGPHDGAVSFFCNDDVKVWVDAAASGGGAAHSRK
ncbi:hypothetical protein A8C56_19220 [Niabella ginsenosidivorans]|uniref:Uncharacterized protein n=1 Tax=Niabella ginsenosidivorans TaxID=1176587 RepID=A0A1A9I6Z9_9BACT|nr:hypothetical protein [Niabella ginsenosidivorans]ANH82829.1 hypothetical protein A8C56_19220 [Niabella ginsenosidivorans]